MRIFLVLLINVSFASVYFSPGLSGYREVDDNGVSEEGKLRTLLEMSAGHQMDIGVYLGANLSQDSETTTLKTNTYDSEIEDKRRSKGIEIGYTASKGSGLFIKAVYYAESIMERTTTVNGSDSTLEYSGAGMGANLGFALKLSKFSLVLSIIHKEFEYDEYRSGTLTLPLSTPIKESVTLPFVSLLFQI